MAPELTTGKPLPPATFPADLQNAMRAGEEIVRHYARELNNPSALIHAVRAFGKGFTLNDGSRAVDLRRRSGVNGTSTFPGRRRSTTTAS
jgi:hypothetical protein